MAGAHHYYRWIDDAWRPYLAGTVLELGAGIGTFSAHLLAAPIDRLILVEPAAALAARLRARLGHEARVELYEGVLEDVPGTLGAAAVDAIVSVNVLEHIPDDARTLDAAHALLRPGGALLGLVPALPFLYGAMDRSFGHVRRYTKATLGQRLVAAGFALTRVRYMNLLGVVPWLVAGRVLRRRTLSPAMVRLGDRTLVRLTAHLERRFEPPLGQSVMAIARKA
jgi:SAM-dependent methyltransferase